MLGLPSLDVSRWNLPLAAVAAAGLACGPTVALEEGETDASTTGATTYYGDDYYGDDVYCADGTAGCCYGDCYEPYECAEDLDCGPQGLCTEERTCQFTELLPDCESTTEVVPLALPLDLTHPFTSLAFVEADGDPGQELVVGRLGRTELYLGPEPTPVELPWERADAVLDAVSGDFGGDGLLDLVVSGPAGLFMLLGNGVDYTPMGVPFAELTTMQLEALDWDANGSLDLAGLTPDGDVIILLNLEGAGVFQAPIMLPNFAAIESMTRGRFGGAAPDDALDDLAAYYSTGTTTVHLASPAGDTEEDMSLLGPVYEPRRLLSGAVGGGVNDEIVSHAPARMSADWSLLELWPDGAGVPLLYSLMGSIERAAMGDIDGDGLDDVVVRDLTTLSYVRGSEVSGGAVLACRASYFLPETVDALEVGDLDGNGRDDVAYVSQGLVTVLLTQ